jgi:mannobiose 2-epimerase
MKLFGAAACGGSSLPDAAAYAAVKDSLREHLDGEVLPFWVSQKINDESYGGYLPYLDRRLLPNGKVEGHVVVLLRLMYVHAVAVSRAGNAVLRTKLLEQYHRKFDFLKHGYWDERDGRFFDYSAEHRTRSPDVQKETRSQVHAIYFLAESYLLTRHAEALELARAIFARIDAVAHDPVYGGYHGNDEPSEDPAAQRMKSLGIQTHLLLALSRLWLAAAERVYRERALQLAALLRSRFEIPGTRGNVYNALEHDWREIPADRGLDSKVVYGHSAELIWYMLDSAATFQRDVRDLMPWLRRLTDALLAYGTTRSGAVYWTGNYLGRADNKRIWWWAQAEAMIALLRVYEATGDLRYWNAFHRVRRWTFRHVVRDRSGTWTTFIDRWGIREAPFRAGGYWQTGFHVTRALLQCEQALQRLIARAG